MTSVRSPIKKIIEPHHRSFSEREINPLSIETLLEVGLSSIPQPQSTIASRNTELKLARLHQRSQREPGIDDRGLHPRSFIGIIEHSDEIRDVNEGEPVTGGIETVKCKRG